MRIVIYGIEDGCTAEAKVYDRRGAVEAEIKAVRSGKQISLSVTGTDKPFTAESAQGLSISAAK